MILYRGGRGPLLAVVALVAMVTGAAAQQQPVRPQPGVPAQPGVPPQNGAQPQNAGAPMLGRPRPTVGPAAPRPPEPQFSVSEVSPNGSNVFGRRTKVGGESRGMTNQQRNGMGQ
jgi:hypothetical protein